MRGGGGISDGRGSRVPAWERPRWAACRQEWRRGGRWAAAFRGGRVAARKRPALSACALQCPRGRGGSSGGCRRDVRPPRRQGGCGAAAWVSCLCTGVAVGWRRCVGPPGRRGGGGVDSRMGCLWPRLASGLRGCAGPQHGTVGCVGLDKQTCGRTVAAGSNPGVRTEAVGWWQRVSPPGGTMAVGKRPRRGAVPAPLVGTAVPLQAARLADTLQVTHFAGLPLSPPFWGTQPSRRVTVVVTATIASDNEIMLCSLCSWMCLMDASAGFGASDGACYVLEVSRRAPRVHPSVLLQDRERSTLAASHGAEDPLRISPPPPYACAYSSINVRSSQGRVVTSQLT